MLCAIRSFVIAFAIEEERSSDYDELEMQR
jgi:hypothetical protein